MKMAPRGESVTRGQLATAREVVVEVDASTVVRRAELPLGRRLVVRTVTAADIDGLLALYRSLPEQDQYHRFFSAYRMSRSTAEEWTRVAEEGGCRLVAVVAEKEEADAAGRLVAEAGYTLLPNGNGEFEITVAHDWQGWLGPYLLDALVDEAAARGVPNLEADILTENRPMLAVVFDRGCVALDHDDFTVVRVAVSTGAGVPTWAGRKTRPRALVEAPGGRWRAEDALREAGFEVAICPGPRAGREGRCPLLGGRPCPLVAEADVVIDALRPDDPAAERLLDAHRRLHPDVPLCVATTSLPPGRSLPPGAHAVDPSTPLETVVDVATRRSGHAASAK